MKVNYKIISLRPYPGEIRLFSNLTQFRAYYEHKTGDKYKYQDEITGGRFILLSGKTKSDDIWLVYARRPHVLAHEISHILLRTFKAIGAHPASGNGEPFCYMLSQIMLESN